MARAGRHRRLPPPRVSRACERAGVTLGVFFQDRTAPHLTWLKRMIAIGALGELFLVSGRVKWYRSPNWGLQADYRWLAVKGKNDTSQFFGLNRNRYGHRVAWDIVLA